VVLITNKKEFICINVWVIYYIFLTSFLTVCKQIWYCLWY